MKILHHENAHTSPLPRDPTSRAERHYRTRRLSWECDLGRVCAEPGLCPCYTHKNPSKEASRVD
jgi:hypothetical protein